MKINNYVFILFIMLISHKLVGQEEKAELRIENKVSQRIFNASDYTADLNKLLEKLDRKSERRSIFFLEDIFYKTHRKMLKHYQKYSAVQDLLNKGNYDCVSGSLLYAFILDRYGIDYTITETDFHVFLTVHFNEQPIIFEVTDPLYGFIKDDKEVASYLAQYAPDNNSLGLSSALEIGNKNYINSEGNTIYNQISVEQLYALQHYNSGIWALNQQHYAQALNQLRLAHHIYPSERISAVLEITKSLSK